MKKENGHYYFETQINDKVPAKMMLESGIFVMVMDSLYAFENKEAINLDYVRTQGIQLQPSTMTAIWEYLQSRHILTLIRMVRYKVIFPEINNGMITYFTI